MNTYQPRYVIDIKIRVIRFAVRTYDIYLNQVGMHGGVIVFTTSNKAKAVAVADYLATLSRELLFEIMSEKTHKEQ